MWSSSARAGRAAGRPWGQNRPGSCQKKSQQPRQSLSPKQNRNAAKCGQNEKYLKYHNGKDLIYQIKPKANITKKTFF